MGGQMTIVGIDCLPNPDEEFKKLLEKRGVVFGEFCDGNKKNIKKKYMRKVKIPKGWGLIVALDRGDIQQSYLIDEKGYSVAFICWCSKGVYDNKAFIERYEKKQLDLSKVKMGDDGWYKIIELTEKQKLKEMISDYEDSRERGCGQEELVEMYKKIEQLADKLGVKVKRLKKEKYENSAESTTKMIQCYMMGTGVFKAVPKIPWVDSK